MSVAERGRPASISVIRREVSCEPWPPTTTSSIPYWSRRRGETQSRTYALMKGSPCHIVQTTLWPRADATTSSHGLGTADDVEGGAEQAAASSAASPASPLERIADAEMELPRRAGGLLCEAVARRADLDLIALRGVVAVAGEIHVVEQIEDVRADLQKLGIAQAELI